MNTRKDGDGFKIAHKYGQFLRCIWHCEASGDNLRCLAQVLPPQICEQFDKDPVRLAGEIGTHISHRSTLALLPMPCFNAVTGSSHYFADGFLIGLWICKSAKLF